MNIKNALKKQVFTVQDTDDLGFAARQFVNHHIGVLPVINAEDKLVGVLKLHDLLMLILPAFTNLMEDFDFVGDFGAMESIRPSREIISKPVSEVMRPPVYVDDSCGLSRAFALLHHHNLTDLPVVDSDHKLLGIASRVDIGISILKNWEFSSGD
jgi:CBS-domain-containing membrane protein